MDGSVIIAAVISGIVLLFIAFWRIKAAQERQKAQQRHERELEWQKVGIAEQQKISEAQRAHEQAVTRESTFEERYLDYIYNSNCFLQIQGLPIHKPLAIDLERIYIPLKAQDIDPERTRFFSDEEHEKLRSERGADEDTGYGEEWLQGRQEHIEPILLAHALKRHDKLVILGDPGSGKTTLLRYMAATFAKNKQGDNLGLAETRIPVILALRDLKPGNLPSADKLPNTCVPQDLTEDVPTDPTTKTSYFKRNLVDGRCLVLLDGLDEVADKSARQEVSNWVMDLMYMYPANRFVVTSRILGYQNAPLGGGFRGYTLRNFNRRDIENFCQKWYQIVETSLRGDNPESRKAASDQADQLVKAVFENDRIERLAVNPLMLSIIAIVHRERTVLPKRRVRLYDDCIDVLLGRWDEAKGLAGRLTPEQKAAVLAPIARYSHQNNSREIQARKLKELLGTELQKVSPASENDIDVFLREIRERSGLVIERGQDLFGFSHLTFQEYLTAKSLRDDARGEGYLIARKASSWWREVALLYCGLKDATSFIAKLMDGEDDMFHSNLFLAGECLADCLSCDYELRKEIEKQLLRLFDYGEYWLLKIMALRTLARINSEEIEQEFIRRLTHEDESYRASGALAFTTLHSDRAISSLIEMLQDENRSNRGLAVAALGSTRSQTVVKPLIGALKDEDASVRTTAVDALAELGSKEALEPLLEALDDQEELVRASAVRALEMIDREAVFDSLVEMLNRDRSWYVRARAVDALSEKGSEELLPLLLEAAKDQSEHVRLSTAVSLQRLDSEAARRILSDLAKSEDKFVLISALLALSAIGARDSSPSKHDESENVQAFEGRSVDELNVTRLKLELEPLFEALNDNQRYVRASAAQALGVLRSKAAVEILCETLKDKDEYVRRRSAEALARIGSSRAVAPLTELLKDKDFGVRSAAFQALYRIHKQQRE